METNSPGKDLIRDRSSPLCSPSGSPEGGNEPSGRAQGAEIATVRPIPPGEAGGLLDASVVPQTRFGRLLPNYGPARGDPTFIVGQTMCAVPDFGTPKEPPEAREARPAALTCPPSEQLHPDSPQGTIKGGKDVARCFEIEVQEAIRRYGVERVLVFTTTAGQREGGTFRKVMEWPEASRRWDSLNSNLIALQGWVQWAKVMQRQKDGAVHYHVIAVCRHDVRGDLTYDRKKKHWHGTPPPALRALWETFSPEVMARYGFGVANILPVYDEGGMGRYLARYVGREIGTRQKRDRGARLVQYSQSWVRTVQGPFCWWDFRSRRATKRAQEVATRFWGSWERMERDVGPQWRFHLIRLLYASENDYQWLVSHVEEDLKLYGGPLFILNECVEVLDKRKAEAAEWKRRFNKAGAITHVRSADTVPA
jgi:hypothetical protein